MRLVYKDMPLPFHTLARPAHEAARCAGVAGKYWPYHDRLFAAQPDFQRKDLIAYADEIGLDRATFVQCLDSHRFAADIDADIAEARALGVTATPTFLINGRPLVGLHSFEVFRSMVDEALSAPR